MPLRSRISPRTDGIRTVASELPRILGGPFRAVRHLHPPELEHERAEPQQHEHREQLQAQAAD